MAIAFSCPSCDRTYSVDEKFAGKITACKGCGTRVIVPDAEAEPEPPPPPPRAKARVVAVSPPAPPRKPGRDEERFDVVAERPRNSAAEDADYYAKKAAKRQRRKERDARIREEHGNSLAVSRTIVGGAATMAIAVIWFFGGLMFNVFFIFPPIMFLLGLLTLIRGLMGHED